MMNIWKITIVTLIIVFVASCQSNKTSMTKDDGMYELPPRKAANPKDILKVYKVPAQSCNPLDSMKLIKYADIVFKKNIRRKFHNKNNIVGYERTSDGKIEFEYNGIRILDGIMRITLSVDDCEISYFRHSGYF